MIWTTYSADENGVVECAPYADGHFVRMTWRHPRRALGVEPLEGSAVVFVSGRMPEVPVVHTFTKTEEPADAEEAVEDVADNAAAEEGADGEDVGEARIERPKRRGR